LSKIKLKVGDRVRVITGKSKGQEGNILRVDRKTNRVIVENINIITKHQKANARVQAGIIRKEAPVHISNVMYLHDGEISKLGYKFVEIDGKKIKKRFVKKTGELLA